MTKRLISQSERFKTGKPPLTVERYKDDVGVTLYCPELNIHTCGKTEQETQRKFIDALAEYWEFLQDQDFKDESPYKEHLKLLTEQVLPALANASLLQRSSSTLAY